MAKLVWKGNLMAELETGETTAVEVADLEGDEQAGLADLRLCLTEATRLITAIKAHASR